MKICPRCELNYMDDDDDLCEICYEQIEKLKKPKFDQGLINSNLVSPNLIKGKITASEIYNMVKYLRYDYYEYDIYDTSDPFSYRNVLKWLQSRFKYAKVPYPSSAGFAYVFEAEDVWNNYFLTNEDFKETIEHRDIESIGELLSDAKCWLSMPVKWGKV